MKLLKEVVEEIKPDKDYEKDILDKVDSIIKEINKKLKDGKAILGGSGAKGTSLKTFDADIFVKFDYKKFKDRSNELSDILEKALNRIFRKVTRLHGSRDWGRTGRRQSWRRRATRRRDRGQYVLSHRNAGLVERQLQQGPHGCQYHGQPHHRNDRTSGQPGDRQDPPERRHL